MGKLAVLCALIVVLAVVEQTFAADFKCYTASNEEKKGDSKKCPDGDDRCFKYGKKDEKKFTRGCAKEGFCKDDEANKPDCTLCDKSECNSGSFILPSVVLSACALVLVKYF